MGSSIGPRGFEPLLPEPKLSAWESNLREDPFLHTRAHRKSRCSFQGHHGGFQVQIHPDFHPGYLGVVLLALSPSPTSVRPSFGALPYRWCPDGRAFISGIRYTVPIRVPGFTRSIPAFRDRRPVSSNLLSGSEHPQRWRAFPVLLG